MLKTQIQYINSLKLEKSKRVCFYAVGMAEGLTLDKLNPKWRKDYFANKFYLESLRKSFN